MYFSQWESHNAKTVSVFWKRDWIKRNFSVSKIYFAVSNELIRLLNCHREKLNNKTDAFSVRLRHGKHYSLYSSLICKHDRKTSLLLKESRNLSKSGDHERQLKPRSFKRMQSCTKLHNVTQSQTMQKDYFVI